MNRKILRYELKRVLFSKIFLLTSILAILFTIFDLYTKIIQGISGTAPFSQWSYCKFLCDLNIITLAIYMLSCTDLFSSKENKVREITSCTAMSHRKYLATKIFSLFLSYCIIEIICILISFLFYRTTFQFTNLQDFLLPICVVLLPTFSFVMGSSLFLGRINQGLLYAWIPIVLCLSLLSVQHGIFLTVSCKSYMIYMPTILPVNSLGEADFYLTNSFLISLLALTIFGGLLFAISFQKTLAKHH